MYLSQVICCCRCPSVFKFRPPLFLIFDNDLPEIRNSVNNFIMFGDDNTLCEDFTLADAVTKLQIMINKFTDWFEMNKSRLNIFYKSYIKK